MTEEGKEAARLRLFDQFMSDAPQLVVQLYILFENGWEVLQGRPFVLWFDLLVTHCTSYRKSVFKHCFNACTGNLWLWHLAFDVLIQIACIILS